METPHLQNKFITTHLANRQLVFDTARLQIWLQHYSKALLVLMAAVNALAGSPSQGTVRRPLTRDSGARSSPPE